MHLAGAGALRQPRPDSIEDTYLIVDCGATVRPSAWVGNARTATLTVALRSNGDGRAQRSAKSTHGEIGINHDDRGGQT